VEQAWFLSARTVPTEQSDSKLDSATWMTAVKERNGSFLLEPRSAVAAGNQFFGPNCLLTECQPLQS
jgi:hypothetical protein